MSRKGVQRDWQCRSCSHEPYYACSCTCDMVNNFYSRCWGFSIFLLFCFSFIVLYPSVVPCVVLHARLPGCLSTACVVLSVLNIHWNVRFFELFRFQLFKYQDWVRLLLITFWFCPMSCYKVFCDSCNKFAALITKSQRSASNLKCLLYSDIAI